MSPRDDGDPLQMLEVVREDTNIPEAARLLGDNPVIDTIDRLARSRREAEATPFEPTSGYAAYSYNQARREAGLPERTPSEPRYTGGPFEPTPAQRVYDAFAEFNPTPGGGEATPTPTDRQMAGAILRAPRAGKALERQIEANAAPETQRREGEPAPVQTAGFMDTLKGIFGIPKGEAALPPPGEPLPTPVPQPRPAGAPMREYPDDVRAQFAKDSGIGYGTVAEPYINQETARVWAHYNKLPPAKGAKEGVTIVTPKSAVGRHLDDIFREISTVNNVDLNAPGYKDVKNRIGLAYTKAALAVEGSGIAKLGWDPKQIVLNVSGENTQTLGAYEPTMTAGGKPRTDNPPGKDQIYANIVDPSVLVHETMHRGMDQLRQRSPEAREIINSLPLSEEYIVRYLMVRQAGDPEKYLPGAGEPREDKQRNAALDAVSNRFFGPGYQEKIDRLEALAAQEVANKRPGGPR